MKSPSIVPGQANVTMHVIECRSNKVSFFRERDSDRFGLRDTVDDILTGQVEDVARVYAFNLAEGWSRDVTEDVCRDVANRAANEGHEISRELYELIENVCGIEMAQGLRIIGN